MIRSRRSGTARQRRTRNPETSKCFARIWIPALGRFAEDPRRNPYAGTTGPNTAGNGSLMRLAPVPLSHFRDPARALELAADSSRTTHAAPAAVDACRYFAGLLVGCLTGASREELLSPRYAPPGIDRSAQPLAPEIDEIAAGSFLRKGEAEIHASGYVVHTLEAADPQPLWRDIQRLEQSIRQKILLQPNQAVNPESRETPSVDSKRADHDVRSKFYNDFIDEVQFGLVKMIFRGE